MNSTVKIIPFPGVSLPHNQPEKIFDNFLRELGYVEDGEYCPKPDGFQNELDDFLHEMGYIE